MVIALAETECCLSSRVRSARANASARRLTRATSRAAACFGNRGALRARSRYPRTAESRLVLPPLSFAPKRSRQRAADQSIVRHPRAFSDALRVAARTRGGGVGTGFEPATARLRSGALPTELTGVVDSTSLSLNSMFGTRSANQSYCAPRAAGPATSKPCLKFLSKRRRWESNPL